jgi:hypothetical protein
MKYILLFIITFILVNPKLYSDEDFKISPISPEKKTAIFRLLDAMGQKAVAETISMDVIGRYRSMVTEVDSTYWDRYQQNLDYKEFYELSVFIYDKYFTLEDIQALTAFYESSVGVKLSKNLEFINSELFNIQSMYANKLYESIVEKLRADGKVNYQIITPEEIEQKGDANENGPGK